MSLVPETTRILPEHQKVQPWENKKSKITTINMETIILL